MEEKSIAFSIQMTAKEVYRFTFYHVYHGFSGLFGLTLSLLAIVNLVFNFSALSNMGKSLMIIVGLWYTVLEPWMMVGRAKAQVKRTKAYQKPLAYLVNAEGITVSQDEESSTMEWNRMVKLVETKTQFLVYSSNIHSFIFPKSMLEGQEDALRQLLLSNTKDSKVKLRGKLKKFR